MAGGYSVGQCTHLSLRITDLVEGVTNRISENSIAGNHLMLVVIGLNLE